jgi:hypothetical protein
MASRAAVAAIAVASAALLAAVITPCGWGDAKRVLWTDPAKVALASGEPREVQLRVSPQHKDWDQWAPSRAGGRKTADEIARAVGNGFAPDEVYVAEVLIGPLGCTEVQMATLDPGHLHGKSGQAPHEHLADGTAAPSKDGPSSAPRTPHRHRSQWSNTKVLGECLVPSTNVIQASEPVTFALVMSGLPVLMLIAYLRK